MLAGSYGSGVYPGGGAPGYNVRTRESYCGRLQGACVGALFGLVLFFASFPVIFWNEQRAVAEYEALGESERLCVDGGDAGVAPSERLNGRLIRLHGAVSGASLRDATIGGIGVNNALELQRHVEVYSPTEGSHTTSRRGQMGASERVTTYTYGTAWVSSPVDSSRFHDPTQRRPPVRWPVTDTTLRAQRPALGKWTLARTAVDKLVSGSLRSIDAADLLDAPRGTAAIARNGDESEANSVTLSTSKLGTLVPSNGALYTSASPAQPVVGDVRITYTAAEAPASATVVGLADSTSGSLREFHTPGTGHTIILAARGNLSVAQMFDRARAESARLTWALRGGGWLMAVVGVLLMLQPAALAPEWVPLIGGLLGSAAQCAVGLMALSIGTSTTSAAMAAAWLAARPAMAAAIAAVAIVSALLPMCARRYRQAQPLSCPHSD